jgi:hypothetical protein
MVWQAAIIWRLASDWPSIFDNPANDLSGSTFSCLYLRFNVAQRPEHQSVTPAVRPRAGCAHREPGLN